MEDEPGLTETPTIRGRFKHPISMSMYRGGFGYFAHSLNAYGRGGKPCPRCGTPIERVPWMNRSSHFCPHCQVLR